MCVTLFIFPMSRSNFRVIKNSHQNGAIVFFLFRWELHIKWVLHCVQLTWQSQPAAFPEWTAAGDKYTGKVIFAQKNNYHELYFLLRHTFVCKNKKKVAQAQEEQISYWNSYGQVFHFFGFCRTKLFLLC